MLPGSDLPWEAPLGAFPTPGGNTRFRVWAPRAGEITLDRDGAQARLEHAGLGVYEAEIPAAPGTDYAYLVDGERLPDPCSRWQPEGLRGPSRVLDPAALGGAPGPGIALPEAVLYELHIGTFTRE